jgi:hypothetical protein
MRLGFSSDFFLKKDIDVSTVYVDDEGAIAFPEFSIISRVLAP